MFIHGGKGTRLYRIWKGMKSRCLTESASGYNNYGGRGIAVCNEWSISFPKFKEWSDNNGYSELLSIDRIDVNGDYEPSNCRWTTRTVQTSNIKTLRKSNTSGYKGVTGLRDTGKFTASIQVNKKKIHIGVYATQLDAAIAYDTYVKDNNLPHSHNGLI